MLAKGKVFVSKEKMAELLSLPEGAELIGVKVREFDEGYEFLVISAEETVCTKKNVGIGQLRRTSVETLESLNKPIGGVIASGQFQLGSIGEPVLNKDNVFTKKQMEQIIEGVKTLTENINGNKSIEIVFKQDENDIKDTFEKITKKLDESLTRKRRL